MNAKTIRIPLTFYYDHEERALPTPKDMSKSSTYATISVDDPALAELLDDAEHYATPYGPDGGPGLKNAAIACVRCIRDVIGWDDASSSVLSLRRVKK